MSDDVVDPPVRLAELLAALSLGIDLGFSQPMEHVLRQCRIALRLADLVELSATDREAAYFTALLVNVGCHTDAHEQALWFGDDLALKASKYEHEPFSAGDVVAMLRMLGSGGTRAHRVRVAFDFAVAGRKQLDGMVASHARLARRLGSELRLSETTLEALGASYETWNGKGFPGDRSGAGIPIAARIAQLAEFTEVAHRAGGARGAVELARRGAGKQFDPNLVDLLCAEADKVFGDLDETGSWDLVIDAQPASSAALSPEECDEALTAISRFVDLKSPYTLGHSVAVADLTAGAARLLGAPDAEVRLVRRAALVSRYGCLGVSNAIWDTPRPLSLSDWERIRLHPYLTERMLHRSPALAAPAAVALQMRERLDGSGYPRGLTAATIPRPARLLAAADVYRAMIEPRPHRPARSAGEAARELRREGQAGRLDGDAIEAVLSVAGHTIARRVEGPAGLTHREIDVLRLIARGSSKKEVAAQLVISPKTVGTHLEHIYAKLGVSTRAEASLFAVQHGLLI